MTIASELAKLFLNV